MAQAQIKLTLDNTLPIERRVYDNLKSIESAKARHNFIINRLAKKEKKFNTFRLTTLQKLTVVKHKDNIGKIKELKKLDKNKFIKLIAGILKNIPAVYRNKISIS